LRFSSRIALQFIRTPTYAYPITMTTRERKHVLAFAFLPRLVWTATDLQIIGRLEVSYTFDQVPRFQLNAIDFFQQLEPSFSPQPIQVLLYVEFGFLR
jgi:hypothetical protein